ncbi:MAG: GTPase RsgA [Ignavibacteria bacterium]
MLIFIPSSAIENKGMEELKKYLEGNQAAAVVGSSGVGKSTLINVLTGTNNIPA